MRLKLIAIIAVAAGLAACAPRQPEPETVVVPTQGTPIYAKDGVTIVGYANDPVM